MILFLFFLIRKGFSSYCLGGQIFGRHKVLFPSVNCQHVGHQLPSHREGGPIPVPSLHFLVTDQSQFVRVPWRQFGGFYKYVLDMLVPLLGNRHAHHLVGRTLLGAA
jgi:hypothetical protein